VEELKRKMGILDLGELRPAAPEGSSSRRYPSPVVRSSRSSLNESELFRDTVRSKSRREGIRKDRREPKGDTESAAEDQTDRRGLRGIHH
jgi:hypothetical protein